MYLRRKAVFKYLHFPIYRNYMECLYTCIKRNVWKKVHISAGWISGNFYITEISGNFVLPEIFCVFFVQCITKKYNLSEPVCEMIHIISLNSPRGIEVLRDCESEHVIQCLCISNSLWCLVGSGNPGSDHM